jgi:shikimate kinase
MAVGKTTVGRRLAARLGRPFRDSDDDLQRRQGRTGRELAEAEGVAALHRWEATHLSQSVAEAQPAVIAAAASAMDDSACVEALTRPFVAWLRARPDTELRGMSGDDTRRRLGDDPVRALQALMSRRAPRYAAVADVVVDVDDIGPDAVVATILAAFARTEPAPELGAHSIDREPG